MKTIPSLLVVEDSPTGMKYICDFLKSINVGVIQQAFNAEDALDILRTQKFSFIITDYRLPGLNGMEFLEQIRTQGNSTPAILLSGKVRIYDRDTQADVFLPKGMHVPAELLERIYEPGFTTMPGSPGLGLAVCKKVIEQHGGEMRMSSKAQHGTTASIYLPVSGANA